MKDQPSKRLYLWPISIVIGALIWLVVVNTANPEVEKTRVVPLVVLNEQVLTDAGLTFSRSGGETVTVTYRIRYNDANRIDADTFRATVDVSSIYAATCHVPVVVEVLKNRELFSGTPVAKPNSIEIRTEEIQNKSFTLTTHVNGAPENGFAVGSMRLEPDSVMVSGPTSVVGRISSVGIEAEVEGATGDLAGSAPVSYYDANGNRIEINDVRLESIPSEINYYIYMLRGKSLQLRFETTGKAAPGYRFTGTECSVKSVAVYGEEETIDSLSELVIPAEALSVEGASADRRVKLDLERYLPSGVTIRGDSTVEVLLKVEALNRKAYQLSRSSGISMRGGEPGLAYSLNPEILSVELSGLPEDLDRLNASDLAAVLDVSGMDLGTHEGSLNLTVPENTTIESVTPFTVLVTEESAGPGAVLTESESSEATASDARNTESGEAEETAGGEEPAPDSADAEEESASEP